MTMKKHTKILLIAFCLVIVRTASMAQSSLTVDASQVYSNFLFTDSAGVQDDSYSGSYSGAYSLGYRYSTEFGLFIRSGLGMRKGGATMQYDGANYMWTLQYAEIKAGVGYLYKTERFCPYLSVTPYFGYLLKANQKLNNEDYDIRNTNSIQKTDFGLYASPGVLIKLSDAVSAYAEFSYIRGFKNLETDANGQAAYNTGYAGTAGLAFTIK